MATLIKNPAPGAPVPPILPPREGFLYLDKAKFAASFAGDVEPKLAAFMAESQVPWGLDALNGSVAEAAWRTRPSWYLVATDDRMIPPDAQRFMSKRIGATVVETNGSHALHYAADGALCANIAFRSSGVPPVGEASLSRYDRRNEPPSAQMEFFAEHKNEKRGAAFRHAATR